MRAKRIRKKRKGAVFREYAALGSVDHEWPRAKYPRVRPSHSVNKYSLQVNRISLSSLSLSIISTNEWIIFRIDKRKNKLTTNGSSADHGNSCCSIICTLAFFVWFHSTVSTIWKVRSFCCAVSSSVNRWPLTTSVPTPVTTTFTAITTLFIKIASSPRSWLFGVISHFIWRATRHRAVFWTFLTFWFLFLHGYQTRKQKLLRSDRRFSPTLPSYSYTSPYKLVARFWC